METLRAKRPLWLLPVLILAQFLSTSLWFAGNAVIGDLQAAFGFSARSLGWVTIAVQLGFIAGTLVFAFGMIADRYSPSRVFMVSSLLAAACNLGILLLPGNLAALMTCRFLTGFFLAGIYPVGMKISADWYAQDLGKALGFLVGALVLGTGFPHFLRAVGADWDWETVIASTSALAVAGGLLLVLTVKDGPFRKRGSRFDPSGIVNAFRFPAFRSAAFAYFGHMWELYAFWAFLPVFYQAYAGLPGFQGAASLFSFLTIAIGAIGCIAGGLLAQRQGSGRIILLMLASSGLCCLVSPWILFFPAPVFFLVMAVWGFSVSGDSPQCSTLVAQSAPAAYTGSALTLVNCLGFSISTLSIQLLNLISGSINARWLFLFLAVGPLLGLLGLAKYPPALMRSGGS
ncbi:MAG: hypothetical protein KIPDCIKN_04208 [Haliscomenobacter sp.]|nr:hypothetical protein [Haliscomenobacter sp.]